MRLTIGASDARALLIVLAILSGLAAVSCSRITATRDFNHGLSHYADGNYEAAVRAFGRASAELDQPASRYNLALASLAFARTSAPDSEERKRAALATLKSIRAALAAGGLESPHLARLAYMEAETQRLSGDEAAARTAYERCLALAPDYVPALRGLVELGPDSDRSLTRLVVAVAGPEDLAPIESLAP